MCKNHLLVFCRLSYNEVLDILQRNSHKLKTFTPVWGDDFNNEQENCLVEACDNFPVFITDFPREAKPFYMLANSDQKTVNFVV